MKIIHKNDQLVKETEIHIYSNNTDEIELITNSLHNLENKLDCYHEKTHFKIRWSEILYFDSANKKTFAYTKDNIYDVEIKLYQIEDLMPTQFIRCSKSNIINLSQVKKFNTTFGSRLEAVMINNEKIIVNRFYVEMLKIKLNGGK